MTGMIKDITQECITLEASLLKALTIKDNYTKFISCLDKKRLIPTTARLLDDYKKWYDKFDKDIDLSEFYVHFSDWHQELDKDDLKYYRDVVFPTIRDSRIENSMFVCLLEKQAAQLIRDELEKGINSDKIQDIILNLEKQKTVYNIAKKDDETFQLVDIDISCLDTTKGIPWFLPSLQAGLGSLMSGQFILIPADANVGKSAFCISQAEHTFRWLHEKSNEDKGPILYCTSEDTKEDLTCRFYSCLYRDKCPQGFEEILKHDKKIKDSFSKKYNANKFYGMPIRSYFDLSIISEQVKKLNPSLIIIDMLDILSKSDSVTDLVSLYQQIRGLANDGFVVLATTQAGNTSYKITNKETGEEQYKHRKWLSDKDTYNSKSGKQGAAYCMIMIGKDDDMPNIRYINTTKKKRGKDVAVTCTINEKCSYYEELI